MADTVATRTLVDGNRKVVMMFTNVSDSTGESGALKVDVSALSAPHGMTCTGVSLVKAVYSTSGGMSVQILADATADQLVLGIPANDTGCVDMECFGGIPPSTAAGATGDLLFTTIGAVNGATYTIILELVKHYA